MQLLIKPTVGNNCHKDANLGMKKLILSIFLLSLLSYCSAQETRNGLSFSLKTGLTFANMYGPDVESETILLGDNTDNYYANHPASDAFKTGLNVGFLVDYRFNSYISLGLGSSYIQKGAMINVTKHWVSDAQTYEDVSGKIYWNQNFWTLELPITAYIPFEKNDVYFQVGLFTGFLIKSEEKGKITMSEKDYKYLNDRKANKTEPGYFIRCGYIYSLPKDKGSIFAELSWTRSIIKSSGSDMVPNPQYYYNQTISINLGYRYNFNFTKK